MPTPVFIRKVEERVGHAKTELQTLLGAVYRDDKADAAGSIEALRIYLDGLERLVNTMSTPPNERPGYTYDSVRPPN